MDKRFFLALALTAVVVVATQFLFPTPKATPRPGAPTADSVAKLGDSSAAAVGGGRPQIVPPIPASVAPSMDSAKAGSVAASIPAETTAVATSLARYKFTNLGAAPISVAMSQWRALDGATGPVDLVRPGERLVGFRLVAPGDTVLLDRIPFQVRQSPPTNIGSVLDYTAAVPTRSGAIAQVGIRYTIPADSYVVHVNGSVTGVPESFLLVDLPTGLRSQEADTVDDQRHLAFAVKPRASGAKGVAFAKLDPGEHHLEPGPLTWVATKNKYFILGVLAPPNGEQFAEVTLNGGPRTARTATQATATVVLPVKTGSFAFDVYAGPQQWEHLIAAGREFENSNPYGGFMQVVVQPFATVVMRVLLWMHRVFKLSYGWVLVIFGIAVRLILWPLNQSAMRNNLKLQRIQPQLQEAQKKFKSDPAKQQEEVMRVYKAHGMSPFSSLSGCLPMLLPMPVLFALFFVFGNTIEFRGVPFLWLHDISLKDPFYILPLAMGLSMFGLSWIGMRSAPPNPQAKMMTFIFPVMMTFFLINFASGLNLYYTVQNLASLPQQWWVANERARMAKT